MPRHLQSLHPEDKSPFDKSIRVWQDLYSRLHPLERQTFEFELNTLDRKTAVIEAFWAYQDTRPGERPESVPSSLGISKDARYCLIRAWSRYLNGESRATRASPDSPNPYRFSVFPPKASSRQKSTHTKGSSSRHRPASQQRNSSPQGASQRYSEPHYQAYDYYYPACRQTSGDNGTFPHPNGWPNESSSSYFQTYCPLYTPFGAHTYAYHAKPNSRTPGRRERHEEPESGTIVAEVEEPDGAIHFTVSAFRRA